MVIIEKKDSYDIESHIEDLLKRRKKDYLTITQLKNGLPVNLLRLFNLTKKKSSSKDVLKAIKPYLKNRLQIYKGARTIYIGLNQPLEIFILNKIKQNPGLSSKALGKNLPMLKKDYLGHLNKLLESGAVCCTINDSYNIFLKEVCTQPVLIEKPQTITDDRSAFKKAYDNVGKGRDFVRIHRLRDNLKWSKERFESVLKMLISDYTLELHGGDPSVLNQNEIDKSYMDKNGTLYITLTWWGKE